jgi:parallel beta-helix repeat protein
LERKTVSGIMLTMLLTSMLTLAFNTQPVKSKPETIVVPDDYRFIQDAINAANQGDTIYVRAGTYYENLVVDKSLSLIGENRNITIIDGNRRGHVIHVKANNTVISNFTIQKSLLYTTYGIYLDGSTNSTIQNNNIADNTVGILLMFSSNNMLMNNNITNNEVGTYLYMSSNNSIYGNNVANNKDGIKLEYSSNNTLRGNNMANNTYNFEVSGLELSHFLNDVDASNTINNKPIYYWISKRDMTVPTDAGYVAIINSTNITVKGLDLKNNRLGVLLVYARDSLISNNKISNDWGDGIQLLFSSNNTLTNNIVSNNNFAVLFTHSSNNTLSYNHITASYNQGVRLYNSSGNMLMGNNMSNNLYGISLGDSSNNNISGNNITNNDYGIDLSQSSNNTISGNNITNNSYGIDLWYSSHNSISGNLFINDDLFVYYSYGNLVWNNTVNGKPLIYLEDASDNTVGDAGQVVLLNCNRIVVENLNLSNTTVGVQLWNTNNSIIAHNNIANNRYGIYLYRSSNNAIYHNNFIDNTYQVSSEDSVNAWDNGYPSGGNYWSDYTGVDVKSGPHQDLPGSDGIGDTPYRIDKKNKDYYPLMSPWLAVPPEHEHELIVSIRAPASLRLGGSTALASIVINQGLNDEVYVELMLVINGTIVAPTTIPVLQAGSSYTLSYLWTPTAEGTYNVTAYARPVPGETSIENNQITTFTTVRVGTLTVPEEFATIEEAIDAAYPGDKILVRAGIYRENIVIDKPGLSLEGENPATTVIDGGIKVAANEVTVMNFTLQNGGWGIELTKADGCIITRNIVTNNDEGGIRLAGSSNNIISENNITDNAWNYGIELTYLSIWEGYWPTIYSDNNTIIRNIITKNTGGIMLKSSNYNNVSRNIVTDNDKGIIMDSSHGNLLRDNNLTANSHNFGVYTYDITFSDFVHDIDASNTVNGKPIYYLVSKSDLTINSDIGYLALINCTNIHVKGLTLENNGQGLLLAFTTNSTIENVTTTNNAVGIQVLRSDGNTITSNTATNNEYGISVYYASFNNITKNTITHNGAGVSIGIHVPAPGWRLIGHIPCENNTISGNIISNNTGSYWEGGIVLAGRGTKYNDISRNTILGNYQGVLILYSASDNRICHNNFIDNEKQVYFDEGVAKNIWDDGYPSGGNYWSDYAGVDLYSGPYQNETGSDGIGDTPYNIDANNVDHYPLMNPFGSPPPPTYALTITVTVGGTTDPAPGTYGYTANSQVQVTAIPEANYLFGYWELDSVNVGSASPYTVLMDKDHTLKAFFELIPPPLSASINPLSASIMVGQSVTFTSTVSGGYAPYTYQWYLNGASVSGATSSGWTFAPTASGIYYVYLKVIDAKGNTTQSETARITAATVPVGGYSIPIQVQTKTEPIITYIASLTIITMLFTKIKQKTKRKR